MQAWWCHWYRWEGERLGKTQGLQNSQRERRQCAPVALRPCWPFSAFSLAPNCLWCHSRCCSSGSFELLLFLVTMVNSFCPLNSSFAQMGFIKVFGCSDIQSNITSGCLWGCFPMRWTFELVGWVKKIAHPSAGGPHELSWGLCRTKGMHKRENLPCLHV